jgi:hypothetical protein
MPKKCAVCGETIDAYWYLFHVRKLGLPIVCDSCYADHQPLPDQGGNDGRDTEREECKGDHEVG